jgi:hypothetical protein
MANDSARSSALARLALAEVSTTAALEGRARACSLLVDDLLSGRSCPLDAGELHAALEEVTAHEASSARGVAAILRAVDGLARLDRWEWPNEALSEPEIASEADTWFEVDLWSALVVACGWQHHLLTTREERQLGRDYDEILATSDPVQALAAYRLDHSTNRA